MLATLQHDRRPVASRSLRQRASRIRPCPVRVEPLEKRGLFSADVVLQWNQAVLSAIREDKPTVGFVTRDLAIVQTAIYDAVNAVDRTSSVFRVKAKAPAGASRRGGGGRGGTVHRLCSLPDRYGVVPDNISGGAGGRPRRPRASRKPWEFLGSILFMRHLFAVVIGMRVSPR